MKNRLACLVLLCAALPAFAADRPYLVTNSAAAEEDEENAWAVENWVRRVGTQRSLTIAPEYAFDPQNSVQLELRRAVDRDAGNAHEVELELKHLFSRIARDGFGWGVVGIVQFEHPQGEAWRRASGELSVALTLPFAEGEGLAHLNLNLTKPVGERRFVGFALAAERDLAPRTTLFGEVTHNADGRLVHAGVRYWVKRERLAVDLAWQRVRSDEGRGSGLVLGLAWYDL